jgi:acyl-CoA thioesterase-2
MEHAPLPWDGIDLQALLGLQPLGGDRYRARHNDANLADEIFGGQLLGQALLAALCTAPRRAPHALHGFFLRRGESARGLDYAVRRERDGRVFSHRVVEALQDGRVLFRAEVSLREDELGYAHHAPMPQVPPPQSLASIRELVERGASGLDATAAARLTKKRSFEQRPVDPQAGFTRRGTAPRSDCWIRPAQPVGDDPALRYALLAYLSDSWANIASRVPHAASIFGKAMTVASLNHGLWFHAQPPAGGWLLFSTDSPAAGGGSGYTRGLVHDEAGALLASFTQEALIRPAR